MKILLTNTAHTLQVVLANNLSGGNLEVTSYSLIHGTSTLVSASSSGTLNTASTPSTLVAAPGASEFRQVVGFVLDNESTTAATVRVYRDVSGADTGDVWSGVLAPGEWVVFGEDVGFVIYRSDGVPRDTNLTTYVDGLGVIELPKASVPSAPAADKLKVFVRDIAKRMLVGIIGPAGLDTTLQPALYRNKAGIWQPSGNSNVVPGVFGLLAWTALGTATARNVAVTNFVTRLRRLGYVSAATAAAFAGIYSASAQFTVGNGTNLGGFFLVARFVCADAATVAGARQFVGMSNLTAAPTNVEPNTLTQCIGVGNGAADTNLKLFYGGSAAQTPIDLGANFPANTLSADAYEIALFNAPSQTNQVGYRIERLNTGHVSEGVIVAGTPGTQLPNDPTLLGFRAWRTNNATLLAVGLDIVSVYLETDN